MKKIILIVTVILLSAFASLSVLAKESKLLIINGLYKSVEVDYPQIKDTETRTIEGRSYTFATINGIRGMIANEGNLLSVMARVANVRFDKFLKYNDLSNSTYDVKEGEVYYLAPKNKKGSESHHVLLEGENFRNVAQKYGIQMKYIYKYNRLKASQIPQGGLLVWLQKRRPKKVAPEIRPESEQIKYKKPTVATKTNTQTNTTNNDTGNQDEEALSTHGVIGTTLDTGTGDEEVDEELQNEFAKLKNEGVIPDKEEGASGTNTTSTNTTNSNAGNTNSVEVYEITIEDEKKLGIKNSQNDNLIHYTTQKANESFYAIAVEHNVTTVELREWNSMTGLYLPQKGTSLIVGIHGALDTEEEELVAETVTEGGDSATFGLPIPSTGTKIPTFGDLVTSDEGWEDLPEGDDAYSEGEFTDTSTEGEFTDTSSEGEFTDTSTEGEFTDTSTEGEFTDTSTGTHIIQKGETLWSIADSSRVSVAELTDWNALTDKNKIKEGQRLIVKRPAMASDSNSLGETETQTDTVETEIQTDTAETDTQTKDEVFDDQNPQSTTKHIVAKGETLLKIAKKYSISVATLREINGMDKDFANIKIGQELDLSAPASLTQTENTDSSTPDDGTTEAVSKKLHTVTQGETLYSVALKYGITVNRLKELNNRRSDIVYPNEELVVKGD